MNACQRFLKRFVDVAGALIVLAVIWPVLLVAAIAVKLTSPGPVFFIQERVGLDGKPFKIYKFRTMVKDAEKEGLGLEIVEGDSRITRVGEFLRRFSLDEFPQLINVLKGEMSLVGPRPTLQYQVDDYDDFQRRRLEVKPGMTGLATVRGRNLISWNQRIEYDVKYIDNYSIWLDFKIMLETISVVLRGEGVYTDDLEKLKVKPSGKHDGAKSGEKNGEDGRKED